MELGWIVYDVFDLSKSNRILCTGKQSADFKKSPDFRRFITKPSISVFKGVINHGIFIIPEYNDHDVVKFTEEEMEDTLCS